MDVKKDEKFMNLALEEARKARFINEVPVGSVITDKDCNVLSKTHNLKESENDPTAHAELLAIRQASRKINSWRLLDATLYVTLEPCVMCMGAIVNSRIKRVVFGARDKKSGGLVSNYGIGFDSSLNHKVKYTEGILEQRCSNILKEFFKTLRLR